MLGLAGLPEEIDGFFLHAGPKPSSSDVAGFLKLYSGDARDEAARGLIAKGMDATTVSNALRFLDASSSWNFKKIGGVLALVSAGASGFHGYKRNHSIGWAAVWFVLGGIFPLFVPVVALAQGFGKRKAA